MDIVICLLSSPTVIKLVTKTVLDGRNDKYICIAVDKGNKKSLSSLYLLQTPITSELPAIVLEVQNNIEITSIENCLQVAEKDDFILLCTDQISPSIKIKLLAIVNNPYWWQPHSAFKPRNVYFFRRLRLIMTMMLIRALIHLRHLNYIFLAIEAQGCNEFNYSTLTDCDREMKPVATPEVSAQTDVIKKDTGSEKDVAGSYTPLQLKVPEVSTIEIEEESAVEANMVEAESGVVTGVKLTHEKDEGVSPPKYRRSQRLMDKKKV
ncbi:uncharacterized protein EV154DRAFT_477755 [Mucor mucedo]|uniref:uncharacterized protein n=1 Tax=Mucor mucedo TaxID=29922 RepID=UPI00221E9B05|nr:uncharacterized protein EV154DRAFT_477755 [Mucor mucedo]KAI7894977.1 hypothetical protein EV154DRAFT_477755 [Mucor mucedo]